MPNIAIKMARVEHGLTQADLAKLVGVSRQTIILIEQGNYNPSLYLCINICEVLHRTLNDLFWEERHHER